MIHQLPGNRARPLMLRPFRISKTRCVSLAWNATNPTKSTPSLSGVTAVSKTVLPLQRGTQPIQRKVSKCVKRQFYFWIPWILRDYEHQSRSLCISCRANESLSFCADGLWFKIWGTEKSIPFVPSERFIISISHFSGGRFNVEVHEFCWRIMMWLMWRMNLSKGIR